MNAYYFRKDKIAVLGAIKAQLPFSGGKYQLLFSWYEIPFPTIFYRLKFQLPHPNRSNSVSSQKYPLKGNERIRESRKLHSKPFTYFFSLGAPVSCRMTPGLERNFLTPRAQQLETSFCSSFVLHEHFSSQQKPSWRLHRGQTSRAVFRFISQDFVHNEVET